MRFGINPTIQTTGRPTDMAITAHDIVSDSPTNNFATLNPLDKGSQVNVSNGNLEPTWSGTAGHSIRSNFSFPKTGKWYLEVGIGTNKIMGVIDISKPIVPASGSVWPGGDGFGSAGSYAFAPDGTKVSNSVYASFLSAYSSGNIIKILYDADLGDLKFGIDSGSLTTAYNINTNTTWAFAIGYWGIGGGSNICNFGQDPTFAGSKTPSTTYTDANGIGAFYYQPPTDALALCTANLRDLTPTVTDDTPQDYFKAVTYSGQSANQSITSVGFQPDLVWIKSKTGLAHHHRLFDSLRKGTNTYHAIYPDITDTERNLGDSSEIKNLTATGFDLVGYDDAGSSWAGTNVSGSTYVAWSWKAGGAPTADNSNTSGAMTANSVSLNGTLQSNYTPAGSPTIYPKRMSINTDAGFSIVKYTGNQTSGATIPHALNKKPDLIIHKNLTFSGMAWVVYHRYAATGGTNNDGSWYMSLDGDHAATSGTRLWPSEPNASVITVASNDELNGSSSYDYMMYCWHSVEGYSKFGSYTGNDSADGPFVYCGFRVGWLMVRRTDSITNWIISDNARNTHNVVDLNLLANQSYQDNTNGGFFDFLSNGFKLRNTDVLVNASGGTYIFIAFAEQPFKYANAR